MVLNRNKELKLYYSIAEVAEMFDIQPTVLRFWEKSFPQIVPKKIGRNIRQYTKEDIEKIKVVHNLIKVKGLRIEAAVKMFKINKKGVERTADVVEMMNEIAQEIKDLKKAIESLQ